jgi:thiamine kinase-like enzyme
MSEDNLTAVQAAFSQWDISVEPTFFRQSHNATLYRVEDLLIRVRPGLGHVQREIIISKTPLRLPETRFLECVHEPVVFEDTVVAAWRWEQKTREATPQDIAKFAASLFGTQSVGEVGTRNVMSRIRRYLQMIENSGEVSDSEWSLLDQSFRKAVSIWAKQSSKDVGVVHGDLSTANLVINEDTVIGIDLETGGVGPQAWDMTQVLGAFIYGESEKTIDDAYLLYRACGGGSMRKDIEELVYVMFLAGSSWAMAHRTMSDEHFEQSQIRLEALKVDHMIDAPRWKLL